MEISFDESSFLDVSNKVAIDDDNNVSTDLSEKEHLPCTPTHSRVSIFVCIIPGLSHCISCFFLCSRKTVISGQASLLGYLQYVCLSKGIMVDYRLSLMAAIGIATVVGTLEDLSRIGIGIIADSATPVSERQEDVNVTSNVTVVWRYVSYEEIYYVYGAVQQFDENPEIDLIVVTDYVDSLSMPPNMLQARWKKLIKLNKGFEHQNRELVEEIMVRYMNESWVPPDVSVSSEPDCQRRQNVSATTSSSVMMGETIVTVPPVILARLVLEQRWSTVHVFYDNHTEFHTRIFVDMLSAHGVAFTLHNVDNIRDLHETLIHVNNLFMNKKPEIRIAVLCRFECMLKVFHAANKLDSLDTNDETIMTLFSHWLAVVYDYSTLAASSLQELARHINNVAIVVVPQIMSIQTHRLIPRIHQAIRLATTLFPDTAPPTDVLLETIQMGILTLDPISMCSGYSIKTLLWATNGRDFSDVGHALLDTSLHLTSELFPNIKLGYRDRVFTVTTVLAPPFVINASTNGTKAYNGDCMELLKELSTLLNFTIKFVEPPDGKYGSIEAYVNGTSVFNGMIGQLQRHEVDIAAAPLAIIPERQLVVDFSDPIYHEYTSVLLKRLEPNIYKWRTLLDPFKVEVLLYFGVALLLVTVVVFLIEKYGAYYSVPEHAATRRAQGGLDHLHESFWYIYGALLCQGGVGLPDSFAGRTMVSAWWIFCIVIVGTYCGNLIAFLTVSKDIMPFNNLEEMVAKKGEYRWGTQGGTNWELVFTTSKLPDFAKVGKAMVEFNKSDPNIFHLSVDKHIEMVKEGGYAWIGDKTTMKLAMVKECDLLTIKQVFLPLRYGFAFQQNSPHTAIFSEQIMKSQEAGLFEIWRRKSWPKKGVCTAKKMTVAKPITLSDVQSAFFVCAIGIVFGSMAFVLEIVVFRVRKKFGKKPGQESVLEITMSEIGQVTSSSNINETL